MIAFSVIRTGIGAAIKRRRMMGGITQVELADQIGVTFQQVGKYEKGSNSVSIPRLMKVAQALGTTPGGIIDEALIADYPESNHIQQAFRLTRLYNTLDEREKAAMFTCLRMLSDKEITA